MQLGILRLRRLALRKSISSVAYETQIEVKRLNDLENGHNTLTDEEFNRVLKSYNITKEELRKRG